jgi:hypothetical protein
MIFKLFLTASVLESRIRVCFQKEIFRTEAATRHAQQGKRMRNSYSYSAKSLTKLGRMEGLSNAIVFWETGPKIKRFLFEYRKFDPMSIVRFYSFS